MSFDLPFVLPDGWEIKTVEQLIKDKIIEKPLDGNHGGIHPKSSDYVSKGIPFVMASDLHSGRVDLSGCKFITEKQAKTLRKGFAKTGDVLISHKATIGRTAIVQQNDYPYIMLTPQVTYYRIIDDEKLSNVYLKSYFDSPFFQSLLALWAGSGSTRAYLGITGQLKLPVIVPPIDSQKFISNNVFTFNEKIELNTQTNQTLEQIAQAIFKSWFVDFDPVKAKSEALAAGGSADDAELAAMSAISAKTVDELNSLKASNPKAFNKLVQTAALFPAAMQDSELGEIPEGWEIGTLESHTSMIIDHRGKTPKKLGSDWVKDGYPAISAKNIKSKKIVRSDTIRFIDEVTYKKWMKEPLIKGDIIMTSEAPMGELYFFDGSQNFCLSQRLYGLRANSEVCSSEFLFNWLQTTKAQADMEGRASGTTALGIKQAELRKVKILTPPRELLETYSLVASNLVDMAANNNAQNTVLADMRDTLLPKLLAGEIDLTREVTA
ncbi:restriction endonuclease subunit S [Vibrio cholerae]|nr:restriction endonuclease subunit S [Vibrio cholerae]EJL6363187.1 restriction endonuclease subunit S [Vibrio cholerae]